MATQEATIDAYLNTFPEHTRLLLQEIRQKIKEQVPEAEERISYGIPAFFLKGALVYYSGYKNHISIYPAPREHPLFAEELTQYKGGKGTIQFPLNQPIPMELIHRIVEFRLQENLNKVTKTKSK